MKSMFIALFMMVSLLSQTIRAAEPIVTSRVVRSFETTFADAEGVQWSVVDNLFKVKFILDDRPMFAFYNNNGELVVSGKYLKITQLPRPAEKKLIQLAEGYQVTEVFEINDGITTKYYATLTSNTERKIMESTGGKWSAFKKSSK